MLRWKTPSAICAMMLTACPLTSFAQQIVKPAPPETSILQPMGPIKIPGQVRKVAYAPLIPLARPQQAVAEYPILQPAAETPDVRTAALRPLAPAVALRPAVAENPALQPPAGTPQARTAALSPLVPMPPIQLRNNPTMPSQTLSTSAKYRRPHGTPQPVERAVQPTITTVERAVSSKVSTVKRAASPKIIIRNPFVQPHNPNLYLFVVENIGTVDATNATVDLYVPQDVTITNVVPASASSSAQRAHVNLANLAAGAKSIIEVEVSPTTNVVEFQTRLALESVHVFSTSANPNYLVRSQPQAPIASQLVVPLSPPTEVVSAIPLEPIAAPKYSVPVTQVSQVKSPLLPLEPIAPTPTIAAVPAAVAPTPAAPATVAASAANPVAETSGRTGRAQPPNIANAALNSANGVQAHLASARAVAAQVSVDAQLSATVDGPVTLNANEEANFSITVTNPKPSEATGIIVQLSVPTGLKVTVLDRDAWFDEKNQTISWEISQLSSGQQETIQYKAVGQAAGQKNQKVTIGMQDVYQGKAQLVTLVSN